MGRLMLPIGTTTINVYDVDYIDKMYDRSDDTYGIRITFFSGAYKDAWFLYETKRNWDFLTLLNYL